MYMDYYAFSAIPFRLSPDARFFFPSSEHNKAMAFLNYGISEGEGFVVVTGEVGAGKTTLVEHLLSTLDATHYVAARIVTTQLDSYDMLRMVAASFNIPHEGRDKATLLIELKELFESLRSCEKRALLMVDEAQSLTPEAIEELRMLSNMQISGDNSFQVVLLGQPEFRDMLASPRFQQVRQRVAASCHLGPLDANDTKRYIEHRLTQVGWKDDPRITADAFAQIYRHTDGVPRRINTLFSRLLLLGFLDQKHEINGEMVVGVARELADELGSAPSSRARPEALGNVKDKRVMAGSGKSAAEERVEPRLAEIEEKLERHDRVINRALDLIESSLLVPG